MAALSRTSGPVKVYVEDRCLSITGNELEWMGEEPTISNVTNGLIAVTPDRAYIHTGMEQGPAEVRVQIFDQAPQADLGGWDEVVEVSFTSTHGNAFLGTPGDSVDFNLAASGPGTYRLRVHAKGRDAFPGRKLGRRKPEAEEEYLLYAWPAPGSPESILKTTDEVGQELRGKLTGPAAIGSSGSRVGPSKLDVTNSQFSIRDLDRQQDRGLDFGALLSAVPDWALITTGIHTGKVTVTVQPADTDPGQDTADWDEISEVTFKSTTGEAYLDTTNGPADQDDNLAHAGRGKYGLRVHARGRDLNPDGVQEDDEPGEEYLIQIWPQGSKRR